MGSFPTWDDAVKASLPALSHEIRRCSKTKYYQICFDVRPPDRLSGRGSILYDRKSKVIGLENDPDSGWIVRWDNVDDNYIHAVVATNGTFESFGNEAWSSSTYRP
jgi:hypothetical protein